MNQSFQSFGEENVDEFSIANNSYYSKILVNDIQFAKFPKVFPRLNLAPYGSVC